MAYFGGEEETVNNENSAANERLSAASRRALNYTKGPEWFIQFQETDLGGDLAYEEGVIRRDPSAVLSIGAKFYVWYTMGS
jgi:hypothetical protein